MTQFFLKEEKKKKNEILAPLRGKINWLHFDFFQYFERIEMHHKMQEFAFASLVASNNMKESSRRQLNFREETCQVS